MNYTYDGDGNRLQKSNGKIYWYGAGTEILDESDASGNITDEYVFFGGGRIARRDSSGNIVYYVADHLGTSRVVVNSTGTVLDQSDFYPFGGERVIASSSGNVYKFEGKERDTETTNDDFGARYYSSRFGRWLSPDWSSTPAPVPYANLTNPQTLNLYAMARDNPETFADLDGHDLLSTPQANGESISFASDYPAPQTADQQAAKNNPANSQQEDQKSGSNSQTTRTPATGEPDTTVRVPGTKPGEVTDRTYGPDGRALKDIDNGHPHDSEPHAHDWDWTKDPPRQPRRDLTPEEAAGSSFSTAINEFAHNHPVVTTVGVGVAIVGLGVAAVLTGGTALVVVAAF